MESSPFYKKAENAVKKSSKFIKKALIAGSIILSAEQGMAQETPRAERFKPLPTWEYEEGTERNIAHNKSTKYAGFVEEYLLDKEDPNNKDSAYYFNGYYTEDGGSIYTPDEIKQRMDDTQKELAVFVDPEAWAKQRLIHQQEDSYKEECYERAVKKQTEDIQREKSEVDFSRSLIEKYPPGSKEYEWGKKRLPEHEGTLKGLQDYYDHWLADKNKALQDSSIAPVYTYEELVSQATVEKDIKGEKLKNLKEEYEEINAYIADHKK